MIPNESLNANLLRLGARVIGFVGGVFILAYGAHKLGLPVLGLVAGLGVGGLAIALAIRPTLENLIGGVILFMDKPVRVGDFCSFGDKTGTVENIGIRSTQVRALDRTLISIPNSTFADMEIINWAECDRMLIHTTIGLRYESEPDQLRYFLAKLREMFYAHPRIDRDTVRVRFAAYGESSLDVDVRVYALTREWNDFYAIREDVFLRVNEIVGESGTSFAFPSQTLYMGRDHGLDMDRSDAVIQQVKSWRRSGQLPFPNLPTSKVEQLADTLDYPPHGSPGADPSKSPEWESAEPLSTEEHTEQANQGDDSERR
jgi:MscS family membrane protein